MSFPRRFDWALLTTLGASWQLYGPPEITLTDSGWDTIKAQYIKNFGTLQPTADQLLPKAIGAQIESLDFWATGSVPVQLGANIWLVTVMGVGIAAERPLKINRSSVVEQQQGDNVIGPWGTGRAVVLESAPAIGIEYVQIGGDPPTDQVGLAGTPAIVPLVRSSVWTGVIDGLNHYPHGWVFMGIEVDDGPGSAAFLITEQWAYIFEMSI